VLLELLGEHSLPSSCALLHQDLPTRLELAYMDAVPPWAWEKNIVYHYGYSFMRSGVNQGGGQLCRLCMQASVLEYAPFPSGTGIHFSKRACYLRGDLVGDINQYEFCENCGEILVITIQDAYYPIIPNMYHCFGSQLRATLSLNKTELEE
jgi:hypothetical protein